MWKDQLRKLSHTMHVWWISVHRNLDWLIRLLYKYGNFPILTVELHAVSTSGKHTGGLSKLIWCKLSAFLSGSNPALQTVNRMYLSSWHPHLLPFTFIEPHLFAKGESSHALKEARLSCFSPLNAWSSNGQKHWCQHPPMSGIHP